MFKIHILNVNLGDSLILETDVNGAAHYSIIDCKRVGDSTPTVEFLKKRKISHIYSLFLTHLHNDHYSGFPQLLEYLTQSDGTLEYFVSPQIPDEHTIRQKIVEFNHDKAVGTELTKILKAMKGLQQLPSLTHENGKTSSVRIIYEGDKTATAWRSHLHPGLLIAPVNPHPDHSFRLLNTAFTRAKKYNNEINSLSHVFMVKYEKKGTGYIGLFTGDIEANVWRFVKNRCLAITSNAITTQLFFFKVPHHGAYYPVMENCLTDLIAPYQKFVASITCPPGDKKHPDYNTLNFLKHKFPNCNIACTNISDHCHQQHTPTFEYDFFNQSTEEAEFMEFAGEPAAAVQSDQSPGICAGDHTVWIEDEDVHLRRSTGKACSFT